MPLQPGVAGLVEARASAALPAAGAWDATPTEFFVSGAHWITFHFTYTREEAGGNFDFQIEISPYSIAALVPAGAAEWITESLYASGAVAAGADSQSRVQREYQSYQATGAAAEDFTFGPIRLAETIERVRIRAREPGEQADPGTLQIQATLAGSRDFVSMP